MDFFNTIYFSTSWYMQIKTLESYSELKRNNLKTFVTSDFKQ